MGVKESTRWGAASSEELGVGQGADSLTLGFLAVSFSDLVLQGFALLFI